MDALAKIAPTEFDVPARFYEDPRGRYVSNWRALVSPRNAEEVVAVLDYARTTRTPVVPYGGGTGLVGGQCFPDSQGAICLSMRNIREIEVDATSVRLGAGVVLDELHQRLEGSGRHFPLSLASSGSAQIGGLIATNAGGVNVIRFGTMGQLVLGLEVVLADGTVIDRTGHLKKDNTGYAIDRLLIGAEGTLGVITRARLETVPVDKKQTVVLAKVKGPMAARAILDKLSPVCINAFELISGVGLEFRKEAGMHDAPISGDWLVLIEIAEDSEGFEPAMDLLGASVVAKSETERAKIWAVRESIPVANRHVGAIASHDISLPVDRIPQFIDDMGKALDAEKLRINCFGHLGDGNLHYNLFPEKGRVKGEYDAARLSEMVHEKVAAMGGSISAEHGIGRYKAPLMREYGLAGKREAMRKIKTALDPENIMNPGVFFD